MHSFIPVDFDPFADLRVIDKLTLTNEPQREIWLSCLIGGAEANMSYNESVSLVITGVLDVAAFSQAISEVVLRHEALRATISPDGEKLIIYKDVPVTLDLNDISGLPAEEKKSAFAGFLQHEINIPMDLTEGPLFKVFQHKIDEQGYYFTIIKHHIIGDGWSTGIILEDLGKLYNAYRAGAQITLAPAAQISDYAAAQASFKQTKEYRDTEAYWLNLYKDNVPVVDLPTDRPRPPVRSYKGNRIDRILPKETVDRLKTLGASAGCSLVTTLLAAFEVFLYRTTRQQDLVVGLPASGQAATGLTDVVGHCVNLLPLKTHIDTALSFDAYLKKRKTDVLDAYDHQRLTFGELIRKLYIPRDASRVTLVPVMFNIDMGMDNAVSFDGLDFRLISNLRAYENFELYLNATSSKDGILLEWSYNTDLFDAATIEAFNIAYHKLLDDIIAAPATSIAILAGVVNIAVPSVAANDIVIPAGENINSLLSAAAIQYADKTAVRFNDASLTYKQLNDQVDQLATYLLQQGVTKGSIVGLSLDRSIELLVCLLAILRTGAVYLPLDPGYPQERVTFMLNDSAASVLITSKKYKGRYTSTAREMIVEDVWPLFSRQQQPFAPRAIAGSDLAYILYTSGSTGKPKGVQITHHNLVNFLLSMQVTPGITAADKLLAITSVSFDISGLELYLPLIAGAELVIADMETAKDGRLLLQTIEQQRITMMQATPSTWQMMLDAGWQKRYRLKMLCGGEALPKELADKLLERGAELWNMYGPTETTIWSAIKQITIQDKVIAIGRPINNTRIYIMDEHGRPVNNGQAGELYIGGDGVAAGYLNRPELTAANFVKDIYSDRPGAKLYRTGDMGRVLDNGELQCLGRTDDQVKIRGHRIELGEIENAIAAQDDIGQCVVLARQDNAGDKRLVAYVTLSDTLTHTDEPSWKDRWDTLYGIGADDKQNKTGAAGNIDGTLLEQLQNSEELTKQAAEWLHTSVARIKKIGAKNIYEIGSGAGQVMFELAGSAESYVATDYAPAAIHNINKRLEALPQQWPQVTAAVAAADDFSAISDTTPDLILINSVVQYFPDAEYLVKVITLAAAKLKDGGYIFIGDMQGKQTLEMYHAMDHLSRAAEDTTVGAFRDVVANRIRIEEELVADPSFFYQLPQLIPEITGVDVQLRKGQLLNETTSYHYDIWLYVGKPVQVKAADKSIDWKDIQTIAQLEKVLLADTAAVVEVKHILNERTAKDYQLLQLLQTSKDDTPFAVVKNKVANIAAGVHPDSLWALGDKLKYNAHVRWSTNGADGLFDAVFIPSSEQLLLPKSVRNGTSAGGIYSYIRNPAFKNELHIPASLTATWRERLHQQLPAYMVPSDFVALRKFPLTPNAKIDRKALPKPQYKQEENNDANDIVLTKDEKVVAGVWSEILGLEGLKPADDFFQLGGHSLLAVKVMVAIEQKTGKRLPIATLFNHSTIAQLAKQLSDDEPAKKWEVLVPVKTTGTKDPLFLIHGGDLNVLLFKSINAYFDEDQPVYGIQALGLNHPTDIPATIEQIAGRYINDLIRLHPDGPYAIAGYSLGGFLAYEMARQLLQMGKKIKFLGIMDTYTGNNYYVGNKLVKAVKKVKRQFHKIPFITKSFIANPKETVSYQWGVVQRMFRQLSADHTGIPRDTFTDYEVEIYQQYSDALDAYVLTPYDLELTLFRVEKRLYFLDDLVYLGWDKFALKGVHVIQVPGDHKTFLYPPHSERFARIIQHELDNAGRKIK